MAKVVSGCPSPPIARCLPFSACQTTEEVEALESEAFVLAFIVRFSGPSSFFAMSYFICTSRFWGFASVRAHDGGTSTSDPEGIAEAPCVKEDSFIVASGPAGPPVAGIDEEPSQETVRSGSCIELSTCSFSFRRFSASDIRNSERFEASFRFRDSLRNREMDFVN